MVSGSRLGWETQHSALFVGLRLRLTQPTTIEYIRDTYLPEQRKKNNEPKNGC